MAWREKKGIATHTQGFFFFFFKFDDPKLFSYFEENFF
jgi:hypothetical protein